MSYYQSEGIVVARYKLGDSDRIIHLYGPAGSIRAVARGARKPGSRFNGRFEPFCRVKLLLSTGRSLDIISQVETIETHGGIRSDLDALSVGSGALALTQKLSEHESSPGELYCLLLGYVAQLQLVIGEKNQRVRSLILLSGFELRTSQLHGFLSPLGSCLVCQESFSSSKSAVVFDLSEGGLLCRVAPRRPTLPVAAPCYGSVQRRPR